MSESWKLVGLNKRSFDFLEKYGKKNKTKCPCCGHILTETYDKEVYMTVPGFQDSKLSLYVYSLIDGRKVVEYIQAEPHINGPITFLSLKYIRGPVIVSLNWRKDEMREYF